ncbi:multiple epidermal growth factor-like domains 9 [Elysia marginata]|uniref:Multiple epidermal growth factor-like domains 9 n=1 Tax=Elysia marginata TaxID=1093978 RepID=A0AAV4H209_9GAST|nr:multiple epidermal growth factor-like domains 9 [Elysia marginata]
MLFCSQTAVSLDDAFGQQLVDMENEIWMAQTKHVIIGPVTNLTVLWRGHSNVVVWWMPPRVYLHHDFEEREFKPGDKIHVTKMKEHVTMVAHNTTDDSVDSGALNYKKTSDTRSSLSKHLLTGLKEQIQWLIEPLMPKDQPQWKCKPYSYFANYTIGLLSNASADRASPVIQVRHSHFATRQEVELHKTQALVPYEEGCVEHFNVVWQEINDSKLMEGTSESMLIPPTVRTANITGLIPGTHYKISVIAQFKSKKKVGGHPAIYIQTASANETETCECNWQGTSGKSLTCDLTPGAKYCTCNEGYEGQFCERCAPGFYRTEPHFPCHACPCNTHGTHRTTCRFVESFLKCDACEIGYTGSMCHICAVGFYRHRKYCVPCHCNGNTPKDAFQMCLPTTGMCRDCQYNTTGYHCEYCKDGYVGDAKSFRKCVLASDSPDGSALNAAPVSKTSRLSAGVVITITMLILLALAGIGFLIFRRYRTWRRRKGPAFWTVGMNPSGDAVDFNSVHNHEARLDDEEEDHKRGDEVDYRDGRGGGKNSAKYLRLVEDA